MARLIDLCGQSLTSLAGRALLAAIGASEGRTVAAEVIAPAPPLVDKVSNAELAAAAGADILIFNLYNPAAPAIVGLPAAGTAAEPTGFGHIGSGTGRTLGDAAAWTSRIVGVNLEPIPAGAPPVPWQATPAVAEQLASQGARLLVFTGNPGSGVTMSAIADAVTAVRRALGDDLVYVAGRMHGAGTSGEVVTDADVDRLAAAGTDIVLLPAPGTTPGATPAATARWVNLAHERGLLAWNSIGTSQEGASTTVIEQIALLSKMSGADVHHIGDSGYFGIAVPENIYAYSVALRGRRHTWSRIAGSAKR